MKTYIEEFIRFLLDGGADGEGLPFGSISTGDDRSDTGQQSSRRRRVDGVAGNRSHQDQLQTLFDPVVRQNGLPVLRADDVQQTVVQSASHTVVQHFEEFGPGGRLGASQTSQEGRFQFGYQFRT